MPGATFAFQCFCNTRHTNFRNIFLSIRIADSRHQEVTANISCARCVIIQTSLSYRLARWRMPGIPTSSTVCGVALPSAKPRRIQGGYAGDIGAALYDQVCKAVAHAGAPEDALTSGAGADVQVLPAGHLAHDG